MAEDSDILYIRDERILISRLKQGSERAFGLLYDRYWHSVCHFASLYLRRDDEMEEVVQEVFMRLWEARATLRDDSDLDSFLFVVTRNLIFTRRHRSFNRSFYDLTLIEALADGTDTSHQAEVNDLTERIEQLVGTMPAQRRHVFELSRRNYLSYREISLELGISEKTVERHINEALKYLRTHLALFPLVVAIVFTNFFNFLWG